MQSILIIVKNAAYGNEALFNALRLAIAIKDKNSEVALKLFLISDAVTAALAGQKPTEGYNIQQMLEILIAQQVDIKLCKTCTDSRGISQSSLIDGIKITTLSELAEWTLMSDKVISF